MKKTYKSEREWADLERADKIVLILGVCVYLGFGTYFAHQANQMRQQLIKTEMVRGR